MGGGERHEQEEGLVPLLLDELHGGVAEPVGHVSTLGGGGAVSQEHAVGRRLLHLEVGPRALEAPHEPVEAALVGVIRVGVAEVPLAHQPGLVAGAPQAVGDRRLFQSHAALHVAGGDVLLVAEALLVAAGHEASPGGGADAGGHVEGLEDRAFGRDGVDVGREPRHVRRRLWLEAEVRVARVVGEEHDDVRAAGPRLGRLGGACRSDAAVGGRGGAGRQQDRCETEELSETIHRTSVGAGWPSRTARRTRRCSEPGSRRAWVTPDRARVGRPGRKERPSA